MIRHFKFLLMVIGALFFVACGSSDSSSASASDLLEGKTFYNVDNTHNTYEESTFKDGLIEFKSYDLTTKEILYSEATETYTLDGDKIIFTDNGVSYPSSVSSVSNGIKITDPNDSSNVTSIYNTLEDAISNAEPSRQISASTLEGKTLYEIGFTYEDGSYDSYSTTTFNNGTMETTSYYRIDVNSAYDESTSFSTYTLEGNNITITNSYGESRTSLVLSLPKNGIEIETQTAPNESMVSYMYLTLEDAVEAPGRP